MKNTLLLSSAFTIMFWGTGLMAQGPAQPPSGDQPTVQQRDRIKDGTGAYHDSVEKGKKTQQGQMNGKGPQGQSDKGKYGPADGSGNKDNKPHDGTGWGANSGQQNGPMDGTGSRRGGVDTNNRGQSGSQGGWDTMQRGRSGSTGGWNTGNAGNTGTTGRTSAGGRGGRGR